MTEKLVGSFRDLADSVISAAPRVAVGIVLVVVALLVAKLAEKLLRGFLVRVKFDELIRKAGLDKTLHRMGIRQELAHFIPRIVYLLLLLLFARTAADAMELDAVSGALGSLFGYLPNLIAAVLILVLGSAAGQFVGQTVTTAAEESGLEGARPLGLVVSALILFIVGVMAIGQLKIDTDIIRLVTGFILAALAVAFGLSFGLGARDVIRNILAGFYAKRILRVGDPIEIDGQRGVLTGITATHAVIESERETITISNVHILDSVAKQGATP